MFGFEKILLELKGTSFKHNILEVGEVYLSTTVQVLFFIGISSGVRGHSVNISLLIQERKVGFLLMVYVVRN